MAGNSPCRQRPNWLHSRDRLFLAEESHEYLHITLSLTLLLTPLPSLLCAAHMYTPALPRCTFCNTRLLSEMSSPALLLASSSAPWGRSHARGNESTQKNDIHKWEMNQTITPGNDVLREAEHFWYHEVLLLPFSITPFLENLYGV